VVVVLIIALIVFGPKRVPELGKSLGHGIRNFKSALDREDEGAEGEPDPVEPAQLPASSEPAPATEAERAEDAAT
jgi:sec-independent protein translocase protein TatA